MSDKNTGLNILLVEDSDLLRPITAMYLEELGHRHVCVADAEQAIVELAARTFDALLTDVRLPGMSGIALIREVSKRFPAMAIIVSSGASELTAELLSQQLGRRVGVLTKPYDLASMQRVIEEETREEETRDEKMRDEKMRGLPNT